MHCIILLPDTTGRVPTAQELRQRGFTVSAAVEMPISTLVNLPAASTPPAEMAGTAPPVHCPLAEIQTLAMAAEEPAAYGEQRPPEC